MSVKFVSCFTSFNLIINDNKILEKYLIDPSAAAMRVGRMDVKKKREPWACASGRNPLQSYGLHISEKLHL